LSMESVRKFADEFHASGKKLHMLLNCYGFKPCSSSSQLCLSADNFELTMAANHLGQYVILSCLITLAVDGWAVTFRTARRERAGWSLAQAPPRCTKCNSSPINGQCTNHCIAV